jgi:protein-S-isoprenylcysteine O-methyltransferase Ste14
MTSDFILIVSAAWCLLFVVWLIGYAARRQSPRVRGAVAHLALQIPASCLLVLCFALLFNAHAGGLRLPVTPPNVLFARIGVALVLAGVGLAIWARLVLGHSWSGLVMTVREGQALVQSGPYALVRHPIYTGLLAAILGTALTIGTLGSWLAVAAGLAGILIRVTVEERLMATEFGETHAAYRARTRKLIPFVW